MVFSRMRPTKKFTEQIQLNPYSKQYLSDSSKYRKDYLKKFGATKKIINISLVDSLDPAYSAGTAFKLVGTNSDDLGRIYKVNLQDELIVNSSVNYGVDDYKNYLIFQNSIIHHYKIMEILF